MGYFEELDKRERADGKRRVKRIAKQLYLSCIGDYDRLKQAAALFGYASETELKHDILALQSFQPTITKKEGAEDDV